MKVVVKPDDPFVQINHPRDLYKAVGRGHLYDYEIRAAKKDAKDAREFTRGKRKPEGFGERLFTLPETLLEHLRNSNRTMYENEPKKFWCYVWHNWSDFSCVEGNCPWCGRG